MAFDLSVLVSQKEAILQGLLNTLAISLVSALFAVLLGLLAATGRKSGIKPLEWLLYGYIQFFRNTPLLVQIYFFYKGLPHLGVVLSPAVCAILALSLQTGAYLAEIFRTGIESIHREQFEGGLSLGFSRVQTYLIVILPQALGIILPPLGNQMVSLMKNSALAAFITVPDLFFVIFKGGAEHFQYLEFFTLGIVLYMAMALGISGFFALLEHRISCTRYSQDLQHV